VTDAALPIERLRKRPDFLACAKAPSCARGSVVVQARPRGDGQPLVRAGFTATKRIGGAVERNRAKRRMREAARLLLPDHAVPGVDYVFIARGGVTTRPWPRLLDDVKSALLRLAADRAATHIP
jgi:ribonuclease P protein component